MNTELQLQALNTCAPEIFNRTMATIWENAPWVGRSIVEQRPFDSLQALHTAMLASVQALNEADLVAFYAGHPELGGEQARCGAMTKASVQEQSLLGLEHLDSAHAQQWDEYNRRYRARFGFPFILCIRQHDMASALQAFQTRLRNDRSTEIHNALQQIAAISRLRLQDALQTPITATPAT